MCVYMTKLIKLYNKYVQFIVCQFYLKKAVKIKIKKSGVLLFFQ